MTIEKYLTGDKDNRFCIGSGESYQFNWSFDSYDCYIDVENTLGEGDDITLNEGFLIGLCEKVIRDSLEFPAYETFSLEADIKVSIYTF